MPTRTIYLITARNSPRQRAHFSVFVPSAHDTTKGTKIHVIGAPMAGYRLEIKRNYRPAEDEQNERIVEIGKVDVELVVDGASEVDGIGEREGKVFVDDVPKGDLELVAAQVPPPKISENFLEPVNDITNRRCQEWTMEYVKRLVALGYISEKAIDIVQAQRDPLSYGIGLRPAAAGQKRAE